MPPEALDRAIAALIANTRRVRRKLSLVEIADRIDVVRKALGTFASVSETVGVSEQQLRDFLSVRRLSSPVLKMVSQRRIDSVDVVRQLGKLSRREQGIVGRRFAEGALTSKDVRAIVALRKRQPRAGMQTVMRREASSRDIKEYVAEFFVPGQLAQRERKRTRHYFEEVLGRGNIRSLRLPPSRGSGSVGFTAAGLRKFEAAAKSRGLTKRDLIEQLIRGGIT